MAKSSEYWKKRFLEIEKASNAYGQDAFRQIEKTFDKAQMDIQKEIERWYGRYAKNNQITMQEAKKQLTAKELKELRWDVEEYIKYGRENALDQKWMKELENASARFHINRLEALKIRTQHAAEKAFGNELDQIDGMARHVFTEDYYHSLFEMQKGFGIGWEVGQIDEKKLNTLITKPWAADGKNFSERIWGNRTALVNELHQQLTRTCILGKAPDDAIKAISKKMNTSKNNAGRLVMTEQAYFHSVAQKEAFKELDVEEFEVVATLDSHTSDICQDMDGQHFPMSQYEPGVTAPPFHVWCRSVTVPYFEDNYGGERAARDENGNTYYVPDNMKYQDWVDHFVDKTKDPADWLKPVSAVDVDIVEDKAIIAETIQEAVQIANELGVKYAQFESMPLDQANNILNAVKTLPEDCRPVFVGNGKDVATITGRPLGRKADQWYGVTYDYRTFSLRTMQLGYDKTDFEGGLLVGINTGKYKTFEKLEVAKASAQEKYIQKTGHRWFFNTKGEATAYHEMGHCYADIKGVPNGFEEAAMKWAKESQCDMLTKTDEAWAEAWAAYHIGNDELPDYIKKFIESVVKE